MNTIKIDCKEHTVILFRTESSLATWSSKNLKKSMMERSRTTGTDDV